MLFWKGIRFPLKQNFKKGKAYRKIIKQLLSNNHINAKRAVLSASMALEAVFVVPLFLFFSVIFIYAMNLMNYQNRVNEAMYDTVRMLSKMEYSLEGSANMASATAGLYTQLDARAADAMRVAGGAAGMMPYSSQFDEDLMIYELSYQVKPPFDLAGIMKLNCVQRVAVRKWIGNEDRGDGEKGAGNDKKDLMVYITESGTVYHRDRNCTYLQLSIQSVSRRQVDQYRNKDGAGYTPCERCKGNTAGVTVYITDRGNHYHASMNCSGLKRGILLVPKSRIPGWPACSRCH